MRILVLGGTLFLGRSIVESALQHGHSVTLFHRGRTGSELFPEAERILGDRDGGLAALGGRTWDAVVDTCGYVPRIVRQSAQALTDCGLYAFVSTVSVYAETASEPITEDAEVAVIPDPTTEEVTGETYGALKALCEEEVRHVFGDRALVMRPGLIVGPHDPTDRFTYWPVRISRGGETLAPGEPASRVHLIDVRDLGDWIVRMLEDEKAGVYNAVGPQKPYTLGELLDECVQVTASGCRLTWVDERFLLDRGVQPWSEMPLWIPGTGMETVDGRRAYSEGLQCRPVAETIRDLLAWHASLPADRVWRAGMTAERERELLVEWARAASQEP
jgi:2'-hydroxyisoflavone reductase